MPGPAAPPIATASLRVSSRRNSCRWRLPWGSISTCFPDRTAPAGSSGRDGRLWRPASWLFQPLSPPPVGLPWIWSCLLRLSEPGPQRPRRQLLEPEFPMQLSIDFEITSFRGFRRNKTEFGVLAAGIEFVSTALRSPVSPDLHGRAPSSAADHGSAAMLPGPARRSAALFGSGSSPPSAWRHRLRIADAHPSPGAIPPCGAAGTGRRSYSP